VATLARNSSRASKSLVEALRGQIVEVAEVL